MYDVLIDKGADFRANKHGWAPLHTAAYSGFVDITRILMDKGANVDIRNIDGKNPLELAEEVFNEPDEWHS